MIGVSGRLYGGRSRSPAQIEGTHVRARWSQAKVDGGNEKSPRDWRIRRAQDGSGIVLSDLQNSFDSGQEFPIGRKFLHRLGQLFHGLNRVEADQAAAEHRDAFEQIRGNDLLFSSSA